MPPRASWRHHGGFKVQRITLQAVKGGIQVVTGGQTSTTIVEGSFPSSTVSVFNTGTVVLATIYGDNLFPPTPKSNPFTADSTGSAFFYAANGARVDVQLSGTGIVTPFLVASDILVDDPGLLATIAPQTVAFSATPTFDLSQASWFRLTLTGNVTIPVFSNAVSGALLLLTLTQDGTGSRTFAWPAAFLRPPAIASAINAVTELIFKYDGTNWRSVAATGDNLQVPSGANITGVLVVQGASTLASLTVTGTSALAGTVTTKGSLILQKADGSLPATIVNDTGGGVNITTNGGKTWEFANAGALSSPAGSGVQLNGATSGAIGLAVPAIAGANVATFPANTGTIAELNLPQTFTASQTIGQTTFDGTTGNVSTYRNVATADFGHPTIYGTPVHLTGQTANLAATNVYAAPVTGLYLINVQCRTTTAGSGTTATFTLTWADEGGAKSFTSGTFALNSVSITGVVTTTIPIHVNSGTAVAIAVTGTFGTSVYAVDAWLERIT